MSDVTAIVSNETIVTSTVTTETTATVSSVGIQGLSAENTNLENLTNIDSTNLEDGSLLIYKLATAKWTASTDLDAQNMDGGFF